MNYRLRVSQSSMSIENDIEANSPEEIVDRLVTALKNRQIRQWTVYVNRVDKKQWLLDDTESFTITQKGRVFEWAPGSDLFNKAEIEI